MEINGISVLFCKNNEELGKLKQKEYECINF